jgi:hypothetical protein
MERGEEDSWRGRNRDRCEKTGGEYFWKNGAVILIFCIKFSLEYLRS